MLSVLGCRPKLGAAKEVRKRTDTHFHDENDSRTANDASETEQQFIDYTPHYEVLLKEGATHFDSISAAIFEHIDNSITAFKALPPQYERKVEVQIHTPSKGMYDSEPVYLAIWDNAVGMNTTQLEAYFTAALGRETRGLRPEERSEVNPCMAHMAGNLSKFGVGALQSFAFLGTQLKVITKDKAEGKIRSYAIDNDYFRQKEEVHGRSGVFKGRVRVVREAAEALEDGERRTELVHHLQAWDRLPHFTLVLIRLQDVHKREVLETQGSNIILDLADVFYYYLKPQDLPSFAERAGKRPGPMGGDSSSSAPVPKKAKTRMGRSMEMGGSREHLAPAQGDGFVERVGGGEREETRGAGCKINMSLAYFRESSSRVVRTLLKDEVLKQCLEGRYWEESAREDVFSASFQVDDPRFVPDEDHCSLQPQQKVDVDMLARYFPYSAYAERRPKYADRYSMAADLAPAERGMGGGEPLVDVRWMARRLPNARYQRLYFFPAERRTAANKAELELCGKQWRERVHVTLFIKKWDFAVSNNKLNVQGDFGDLLKNPRRCISTEPRDLPAKFLEWVQHCHKKYDRENVMEAPYAPGQLPPEASKRPGVLYFQRVRFGSNENSTWRKDEVVWIPVGESSPRSSATRAGRGGAKRGRGRNGRSPSLALTRGGTAAALKGYVVRISHFEVDEGDDLHMATTARAYYTRLPPDVFGAACAGWESVSSLDPRACKLQAEEVAALEKEVRSRLAHGIDVYSWDGSNSESKQKMPQSVEWVAGDSEGALQYGNLLVMVRDQQGLALSEHIAIIKGMYSARLKMTRKGEGGSHAVEVVARTESKTIDVDGPCYAFQLPRPLSSGRYLLDFSVTGSLPSCASVEADAFHVLITEEPPGEPTEAELTGLRPGSRSVCLSFSEEMPLPAFSVVFKDPRQRPTWASQVILSLRLKNENFGLEYRGKAGVLAQGRASPGAASSSSPSTDDAVTTIQKDTGKTEAMARNSSASVTVQFTMEAGAVEKGVCFETGDWVLIPDLGRSPLLGAEFPDTLTEAITLTVIEAGKKMVDQRFERELVIEPGLPVSLQLVEPVLAGNARETTPETAIKVASDAQALPALRFKVLDLGGNVTAPNRGQRWTAVVEMEEEGVRLIEPSSRRGDSGWKISPSGELLLDRVSLEVDFRPQDKGKRLIMLEVTGMAGDETFVASPVHVLVEAQRDVPRRAWLELRGEGLVKGPVMDSPIVQAGEEEEAQDEDEKEGGNVASRGDAVVRVKPERRTKMSMPAGESTLSPRVVVADILGEAIDSAKVHLRLLATCSSWARSETVQDSGELPGIPGPTDKVVKLQVQVFHAKQNDVGACSATRPAYIFEAEIHPLPGKPDHISFSRDLASDVRCGEAFNRQTSSIQCRDRFKNFVHITPSQGLPCPTVQWLSNGRNSPLKQEPQGCLRTVLGEDGAFHLPATVTLCGKATDIKLRVVAPGFTPMKSVLKLLPGSVCTLKLMAPQHGVKELAEQASISLCRGEKLESLAVAFFDQGGNRVNPPSEAILNLFWANAVPSEHASRRLSRSSTLHLKPEHMISSVRISREHQTGDPDNFIDPQPLALPTLVYDECRERTLRVELKATSESRTGGKVICAGDMFVKSYRVNRVVRLRVVTGEATPLALSESEKGSDPSTSPTISKRLLMLKLKEQWDVNTEPPALGIFLETEDGEAAQELNFSADSGAFKVQVVRPGTARVQRLGWYSDIRVEEGVLERQNGKRLFVLRNSPGVSMDEPGAFQIKVTYVEQRKHIKAVTPDKDWKLEESVRISVRHNRAVSLRPESGTLEAMALSASNDRDDALARVVLERACIYPVDNRGKSTWHGAAMTVSLVQAPPRPPDSPQDGVGPSLRGGHIITQPEQDAQTGLTKYMVPEISLESDVGTRSGKYRLKFDVPGLKPYFKTVNFTTDVERQQKVQRLNQELNPLRQEMLAWRHKIRETEEKLHKLNKRIHEEFRYLQEQAGLFPETVKKAMPTSQQLEEAKVRLEIDLRALRSQEVAPLRRREGHLVPAVLSQGFKEVVAVGFVADRRLAEMLSWYATPRNMKAIICQTNADYKRIRLLQSDVTVYSLQDTEEYWSKSRTKEQILKDKCLPLQPVDPKFNFRCHAVNAIILRDEDEHLRMSVFWSMFSNTIILETEDDALAYREYCKRRGIRRPTILCYTDGRRLRGSGPLDGSDCFRPSDAQRLEFVFGGQDPLETDAFKKQVIAVEKVEQLLQLLTEKNVYQDIIQEGRQDNRVQKIQDRVVDLENELEKFVGNLAGH
ncbi:hypothetical protein NSK_001880 [Nannochloropsis salina CCMP1776]|jgi:hypothetical protein|uniref:SMCHD1 ribosomal S5 domain-containing protein n=1 Tax=Nannochloropsis salina CCMP1776 TaxID=1027361 RepID=A0A4D9D5E9_9STRA|nr:hypothetical protein NSK_001880 [Nannochloropsis salina CCMP1776]|eukprot:TFJ86792.1 hypothetical protein NSK_001880 [Nannochloropsis salina CCMP1776]